MTLRRIQDIDLRGKRALVRFDLNVPIDEGAITETTRIERVKPTVDHLRKAGAKTVILAHLGRPKGWDTALSLQQITDKCADIWGVPVSFVADITGAKAVDAVAAMKEGGVLLLENIRFEKGEEENEPSFVRALANLGDVYINDGFSVAHRAHASTAGLADELPSAAGLSMQAEIDAIASAVESPARPVMAVIGGSKVSSKLAVLEHLVDKMDALIIGGGMANTFLLAQGYEVGGSLAEPDLVPTAQSILKRAEEAKCRIILPVDVTATLSLDAPTEIYHGVLADMPQGFKIVDIGPDSVENLKAEIGKMATVMWNGPLGVFERPPFDAGTVALAQAIAGGVRERGMVAVAGGGDTLSAIEHAGLSDADFTYLSTAGGAFLEWLEGKDLPGVTALKN